LANTLSNLGLSLRDLGQHENAKKCFERALAIQEMAYGKNHPSLANTLNNLGLSLRDLGQHEEAKKCFEMALAGL
jgi:tetratricopeptide (TPR) repeat protein